MEPCLRQADVFRAVMEVEEVKEAREEPSVLHEEFARETVDLRMLTEAEPAKRRWRYLTRISLAGLFLLRTGFFPAVDAGGDAEFFA